MIGVKKAVDSTFDLAQITKKEYKIKCKYEIAPFRTEAKD